MAEHDLKTWPSFFNAIAEGRKTFEARRADRDFDVGDVLILHEWDPTRNGSALSDCAGYTTREMRVRVTYVLRGGEFGVLPGYCVMAIQREE